MARVYERNAKRLDRIVESFGWPGAHLVGPDGAAAAWIVLQHAIAEPDLLRRTLPLLRTAAQGGKAPARQSVVDSHVHMDVELTELAGRIPAV